MQKIRKNEAARKPFRRTKIVMIFGFVIGVALIPFLMAGWYIWTHRVDINDPEFRHQIERDTGLTFPAETKWIRQTYVRWQDFYFIAVIEIPKNKLDSMVKIDNIKWSTTKRYLTDSEYKSDWFNPDSIYPYHSMEAEKYPDQSSVLYMLYGDKKNMNGEIIKLYIASYGD